LNALVYPKFFNYGERGNRELPSGPIYTSEKLDGHCIIISLFDGRPIASTRGRFLSPTARLAQPMIDELWRKNIWSPVFPPHLTVIAEFINPRTRVLVDYGERSEFVITGAYSFDPRQPTEDYERDRLEVLAWNLNLPLAGERKFESAAELLAHIADPTVRNAEGYVARFADGTRLKFKFRTYVALMFSGKLSRSWVMRRIMDGKLDDVLAIMSASEAVQARQWAAEAMTVQKVVGTLKQQWTHLYELVPAEERTGSYTTACRAFVRWLADAEQQ
jgi:hypothetical protein